MPQRGTAAPPRLHRALAHLLTGCALIAAILLFRTSAAPAAETLYYLGSLGQGSTGQPDFTGVTLPNNAPYGQVNIACRTGWRFLEPKSGTWDWGSIEKCKQVAASTGHGAKWSLSIKIGADTPLWLFKSSACTATPVSGEDPPSSAGSLTTAFQFTWTSGYGNEYSAPSTQCIPIPWDSTNFQPALNTFIQAVYSHILTLPGGVGQLDHVVVTGINYNTQENSQPHCNTAGCGFGGGTNTDVGNWEAIIHGLDALCTGTPPPAVCTTDYNGALNTAYNTIIGYWGTTFPTTRLASMFIDTGVFPFNSTRTIGLDLLNDLVNDDPTRSIVMNNGAQTTTPMLDPSILCYQGIGSGCPTGQLTSNIAFQEVGPLSPPPSSCSNLGTLLTNAASDSSLYMEIYPLDITSCSL